METLDIILVAIALSVIVGIGIYIAFQKKVEKAKGDGPVLRPEDETDTDITGSIY
jgi:ABC-type proline/glycine betaine transport system permease subunit